MQTANKVLMIRPAKFYSNPETAIDNSFQELSHEDYTLAAQKEFDELATNLQNAGIQVCVIQDTQQIETPDSIFPNNRLSFHVGGVLFIYPMKAPNRQQERQLKTLPILEDQGFFKALKVIDFSSYEKNDVFLEGTGSMVFDNKHKTIYAALSQRTNETLVSKVANGLGYSYIVFNTSVETPVGLQKIYHTNVMLAIAESFVVIVDKAIDSLERESVLKQLVDTGREIISITIEQMNCFCGNILQLENNSGDKIIAMSKAARNGFTKLQLNTIQKHNEIIVTDISVIEKASGGSVRCMLAEIF